MGIKECLPYKDCLGIKTEIVLVNQAVSSQTETNFCTRTCLLTFVFHLRHQQSMRVLFVACMLCSCPDIL